MLSTALKVLENEGVSGKALENKYIDFSSKK